MTDYRNALQFDYFLTPDAAADRQLIPLAQQREAWELDLIGIWTAIFCRNTISIRYAALQRRLYPGCVSRSRSTVPGHSTRGTDDGAWCLQLWRSA